MPNPFGYDLSITFTPEAAAGYFGIGGGNGEQIAVCIHNVASVTKVLERFDEYAARYVKVYAVSQAVSRGAWAVYPAEHVLGWQMRPAKKMHERMVESWDGRTTYQLRWWGKS